ncbi:hypothetical protein DEV92_101776 [Phyllobacterium myrsinacearum]|nr:hypothetical protein DEV92_101776 [Phyllobacterium myrsinacearum]RZS89235.1 hypothetical protein EV217_1637 [Phyllobacterium myrsinacearum]RZV09222.1 hypothetical protein EV654_0310 [Phyllobacterium myrsinacearum]
MASTDYTAARAAPDQPFRRLFKDKDRVTVAAVFTVAFAFHLAALFNLLPA